MPWLGAPLEMNRLEVVADWARRFRRGIPTSVKGVGHSATLYLCFSVLPAVIDQGISLSPGVKSTPPALVTSLELRARETAARCCECSARRARDTKFHPLALNSHGIALGISQIFFGVS